jgi:hypothetical protein
MIQAEIGASMNSGVIQYTGKCCICDIIVMGILSKDISSLRSRSGQRGSPTQEGEMRNLLRIRLAKVMIQSFNVLLPRVYPACGS